MLQKPPSHPRLDKITVLRGVRLYFERESMDPQLLADVEALERDLRPKTLEQCFEAFVLVEPWEHYHPSGRREPPTRDVGLLAEAVGRCLVRSGEAIEPFLERAVTAEGQTSVWPFSRALAKNVHDLDRLWEVAYARFASAPADRRHFGVLGGILDGATPKDTDWVQQKLDRAVDDPLLSEGLVMLHGGLTLDARSVERFAAALASGGVPPAHFFSLQMGGTTKTIPAAALARFLSDLFAFDEGVLPALEVLHMRIFGDRSDGVEVEAELIEVARRFLADPRTYSGELGQLDYALASIAESALDEEGGGDTAIAICRALREAMNGRGLLIVEPAKFCGLVMQMHPRAVLEELVAEDVHDVTLGAFFGGDTRDKDDMDDTKIDLDETEILSWTSNDREARPIQLARIIPYTTTDKQSGDLCWSHLAEELIDLASDPIPVLNQFERRFRTGASYGPFSNRLARRRPLIQSLLHHSDSHVRNWARESGQRLEEQIRHLDEMDSYTESRFE